MTEDQRREAALEAERWFELHGLPYFGRANEQRVLTALSRARLVPVATVAALVGLGAGVAAGIASSEVTLGIDVSLLVMGALMALYALSALHLGPILAWALKQTFGSLSWLFPLVTRALPMLLLFVTFLFINAEVWQVSSNLSRELLALTVMLFTAVAVAFLLVRLPEEVHHVSAQARGERLVALCRNTPVASVADEVSGDIVEPQLSRLQRGNLVLVLLFAQLLQVLLLAGSMFGFFLVFGKLAIRAAVIESWVGHAPTPLLRYDWLPISNELFQVSVFLAAFSGLYFTVYAVSDDTYREQFFSSIAQELERAVGVHTVYRVLTAKT